MSLEASAQNTQKIGSINALRFFAAIFVVFYHYAFVFFYRESTYVDLPILRHFFQYGYLGVDLFFIISGFVISLSAEGRGAYGFLKSRIGRLYPVFWVSALITTLFIIFGGYLIYSEMSWSRFLTNMTMVPSLFNADALDGTYWTLAVEMKFYIVVFLLLAFKKFKDIEPLAITTSFILLFSPLYIPHDQLLWIPNFIAGILFYKIYKNGLSKWRIIGLCNSLFISLIFAIRRVPFLSEGYVIEFKPTTIAVYIVGFYILFMMISLNKFRVSNNKYINTLGLLTYPVYLLHNQIGRIMFNYADIKNIPLIISVPSMLIFVIILSYGVHRLIERRGRLILDKALDKITPSNLKGL